MNTIGIRINVPEDVYNKLQKLQAEQTKLRGKKPALSAIILDFCFQYLETDKNVQNDVQNPINDVQNHQNNIYDDENYNKTVKRLQNWENELAELESSLNERENKLRNRESEVLQKQLMILDVKRQVLDEREKIVQNSLSGTSYIAEIKMMESELKSKNEKIVQLNNDLKFIKDKLISKIENQNEPVKKSFFEQLKDYLPLIGGGAALLAAYLTAQKNKKPALPPVLQNIAGIFSGLPEQEQKSLGNKIKIYVEKLTNPPTNNQTTAKSQTKPQNPQTDNKDNIVLDIKNIL